MLLQEVSPVFSYKQFPLRIQTFDIDGELVALKKNHSPLTIDYSVNVGAVNLRNGKYDETNSQHREPRIANHDLETNFFFSFLFFRFFFLFFPLTYLRILLIFLRGSVQARYRCLSPAKRFVSFFFSSSF
jgi:hypothetical protein